MNHDSLFDRPDPSSVPMVLPVPEVLPADPPYPGFWWAALWCLAFITVTQVPAGIVAALVLFLQLARGNGAMDRRMMGDVDRLMNSDEFALAMMPAMLIAQLLAIGFSWLLIRVFIGKDWTRTLALRLPSLSHTILALLGLPGIMIIATGLDALAKAWLPKLIDLDETMALFDKWPWPVGVLVIGLGPGIGEELWCRGFLGRGLVARHGAIVGVLLTSLLFGLLHVVPRQVVYATGIGMLLHWSYLLTRSLLVPMMLHTANNSLSVLASRVPGLESINAPGDQVPLYIYAAGIVVILGVGWALYQSRTRFVTEEGAYPWRPAFPGVEYPPPGSGTGVDHPRPSLMAWAGALGSLALLCVAIFLAS